MGNCLSSRSDKPTSRDISYRKNDGDDEPTKYQLPNFDAQTDRITLQHYLFRSVWQSNFSSPIEDKLKAGGMKVLDVGCGRGIWALDMASEYNASEFTGIDIVDNFAENSKSNNIIFKRCNILDGLPYEDNAFDFTHARFLALGFTEEQFREKLLPELIRVTKPGGFVELMEIDAQGMNEGPTTQRLMEAVKTSLRWKHIVPVITPLLPKLSESAGLTDIQQEEELHPIGHWGEKIGEVALKDWKQWFLEMKKELGPILELNDDGYDELIHEFNMECDDFQTYWTSVRVYGVKPIMEG